MKVLGINLCCDRSACLVEDGDIVCAATERRLKRSALDRDSSGLLTNYVDCEIPFRSLTHCLQSRNTSIEELDLIVIDHAGIPFNKEALQHLIPIQNQEIISGLDFPSHHLAHAANAFLTSGFESAAVVICDDLGSFLKGEIESETIFHAQGNDYNVLWQRRRSQDPNSLGLGMLQRIGSQLLGFEGADECSPGTLGCDLFSSLSAYGEEVAEWPPLLLSIDDDAFSDVNNWLESIGVVSNHSSPNILAPNRRLPNDPILPLHLDIARKIQKELETAMILAVKQALEISGERRLCLGGFLAANTQIISRIRSDIELDGFHVAPVPTDAGNAIGAALWGSRKFSPRTRYFPCQYVGKGYSNVEIDFAVSQFGLCPQYERDTLIEEVARRLCTGEVIAWFQGRAELGDRTYGSRCILADPRKLISRDILNSTRKSQYHFSRFTLITLPGELDRKPKERNSYVPETVLVPAKNRWLLEGAIHIDGTVTYLEIEKNSNPLVFALLNSFKQKSKIGALISFTFNALDGHSIESPADAIDAFLLLNKIGEVSLAIGKYLFNNDILEDSRLWQSVPALKGIPLERRNTFCLVNHDQQLYSFSKPMGVFLSNIDGNISLKELARKIFSDEIDLKAMTTILAMARILIRSNIIELK